MELEGDWNRLQWGYYELLNKLVLGQLALYMEKELESCFTPNAEISSRWIVAT